MTRILCPTATTARFLPLRGSKRRYWAPKYVALVRPAACAASTSAARSQGLPLRVRLTRPPTAALAGAFVVAWRHTCPRRQVGGGWEACHVHADLGHEHFGGAPTDARNGVEQRHGLLKRAHALRDLGVHQRDEVVQEVDVRQLLCNQEALVGLKLAGKRLLELGHLLAQSPTR
jgi:hypothetical protein